MPLTAIHCPYKRKDIPLLDCLACSKTQENKCGYPAEVVEGILYFNSNEDRKGMVSATAILNCIRAVFLAQTNNYSSELDNLYWAFRGQLIHKLCEQFKQENAITEKRFYRTVGKLKISGKMDAIYPDLKLLRDFKTTKMCPRKDVPYSNHVDQCNVYRWILQKPDNEEPIPIERMVVSYFDMAITKTIECPILPEEEIEAKILANGSILQNAFDTGEVPDVCPGHPTDWQCNGYCPCADICGKIWKMGKKC